MFFYDVTHIHFCVFVLLFSQLLTSVVSSCATSLFSESQTAFKKRNKTELKHITYNKGDYSFVKFYFCNFMYTCVLSGTWLKMF